MDAAVRARFEVLATSERDALVRAAQRVTGRRESAEDASQEALLFALRQGSRVVDAPRAGRWLRWLAMRQGCVELRQERRRRWDGDSRLETAEIDARAERRDDAARVARECAALPMDLAEALRLRFEEGLTFTAIATRLGVAEATAHARVRRGLELLRERLTPRRGHSAWWMLLSRWPRVLAPLASAAAILVAVTIETSPALLAEHDVGGATAATAESPIDPTLSPTIPFDVAEFARRVPLSAYLDAGGTLPPTPVPAIPAFAAAAVRGRVFDPRAATVAGAVIEVRRACEDVELSLCVASTTSDEHGDFALDDVPAREPLTLVVRWANAEIARRPLWLEPRESLDVGSWIASARVDETPGDFTLDATLVDETGAPLPSAIVVLSRVQLDASGRARLARESAGRTDAAGRIRLDGRWLGTKRVDVLTDESPGVVDFTLDRAGSHSVTWTLVPARHD